MPNETLNLSREQHEEFDVRGVLRLPDFYPKADIDVMADRLWAFLDTHHGMHRDRPESWTVAHPAQFQTLKRAGAFAALGSQELFALADALLGPGNWHRPPFWGAPLVTFPTPVPTPPHAAWHLDIDPANPLVPMPTLRVFTFLEPLVPHGGGTLYVAGSHRLAIDLERAEGRTVRSKEVCSRLREDHPWFADLLAAPLAELHPRIGETAEIGPYQLRLEEMTGAAGDVIVMHPAIVHGIGHNARDRPRLMLTEWIPRRPEATGL